MVPAAALLTIGGEGSAETTGAVGATFGLEAGGSLLSFAEAAAFGPEVVELVSTEISSLEVTTGGLGLGCVGLGTRFDCAVAVVAAVAVLVAEAPAGLLGGGMTVVVVVTFLLGFFLGSFFLVEGLWRL
jgi:hypothetical protein